VASVGYSFCTNQLLYDFYPTTAAKPFSPKQVGVGMIFIPQSVVFLHLSWLLGRYLSYFALLSAQLFF
jgi:hypothetical protein